MKVQFLGHAGLRIEGLKTILIDPWLSENKLATLMIRDIKKADYIVVTHDHFDHASDVNALGKQTGAKVVAVYETAQKFEKEGLRVVDCNLGGPVKLEEGLEMIFVQAFHSMTSNPSGVIVKMDGKTIYHAGDTAVFGDMKLIGELYPIDVAFLPAGGHYTMGPREAAKAADLINPKRMVPIHYNTFDAIKINPEEIREYTRIPVEIMKPGDVISL